METIQVGNVGLDLANTPDAVVEADPNAYAYANFYDSVSKFGGVEATPVDYETWLQNPAAYNVAPVKSVYGASNTIEGPGSALAYDTINIMGHTAERPTGASLRGWTYDPKFKGKAVPFSLGNIGKGAPPGVTGLESFSKPEPAKLQYPIGNFGTTTPSILAGMTWIPRYTQDQLNRQQYQQYSAAVSSNNSMSRSNALANWIKSSNPHIPMQDFKTYWNDRDGNKGVMNRMPSAGGTNLANFWLGGGTKDQWSEKFPGIQFSEEQQGEGINTGFSGGVTLGQNFGEGGGGSAAKLPGASPNLGEWGSFGFTGGDGGAIEGAGPAFGRSNKFGAALTGPGYAEGGQIGMPPGGGLQEPQGTPNMMGQPQGAGPASHDPQQFNGMVNYAVSDMLQRNPQVGQQIRQAIDQAFASGQVTPQQAKMVEQLAQACINNPALWPQLKAWAEQQGLAGPGDLPEQFDKGLVSLILVVARTYAVTGQGGQGQAQPQSFAQGGLLQGPGTGTSDSIQAVNSSTGGPVRVSNGEYVIPAHVVAAKGTDFFDSLISKYQPQEQA